MINLVGILGGVVFGEDLIEDGLDFGLLSRRE